MSFFNFDDLFEQEPSLEGSWQKDLGEDVEKVERLLEELPEPLEGQDAGRCLRQALDCPPELFRQVLEHCAPGEYIYGLTIEKDADGRNRASYIFGRGSLLLLAAMADRPAHVRVLLEHGYDCNGAGLELAANRDFMGNSAPAYGTYGGTCHNVLQVHGPAWEADVSCATPLSAALLCGSLGAAEELLRWSGVWKGESSAVCRAAVMVLDGLTGEALSEERRNAQPEVLRQVFCPERGSLPDKEEFLRTSYLQPVSFLDFCSARTLRCQLESGLCGERDARYMLELLERQDSYYNTAPIRAAAGKLLLLKHFFPRVCREPWATGVFLREALRRCIAGERHKMLLTAWKQLCGKERDLTWIRDVPLELDSRDLRRFLDAAEEGGTLVMDADAVDDWKFRNVGCMIELVKRVRFRYRDEAGVSGMMKVLLDLGSIKLLRCAAERGLLDREDPAELLEHLRGHEKSQTDSRILLLTCARRQTPLEDTAQWQDPHRWAFWNGWDREEVCQEELQDLMRRELPREDCLRKLFHLRQFLGFEILEGGLCVGDARYPRLEVTTLTGVACCSEWGQAMALLMELLPGSLRETVQASWGDGFSFRGTPLCLSAALGRTEQVRLLLDAGVHPDEVGRGDDSRFYMRRKDYSEDSLAVTPLLAAILFGQEETARVLLERGAACDFSRFACRKALLWGSAASLALAESLPGVGFQSIPEEELEALHIQTSEDGEQTRFWRRLAEPPEEDGW